MDGDKQENQPLLNKFPGGLNRTIFTYALVWALLGGLITAEVLFLRTFLISDPYLSFTDLVAGGLLASAIILPVLLYWTERSMHKQKIELEAFKNRLRKRTIVGGIIFGLLIVSSPIIYALYVLGMCVSGGC